MIDNCGEKFETQDKRSIHQRNNHKNVKFTCKICLCRLIKRKSFKNEHPSKCFKNSFCCHLCFTDKGHSRSFKSEKVFKEHHLDHDEWNQVHYKDTATICYICGSEFQTPEEHTL